jgi:hypothetical protein
MANMSNTGMTLADFERLLDVYGGDRTRWPAEARAAAAQLVAREQRARLLLAEAEALDRVLERAPLPSLASEAALAERIVAAAQRSPRMVRLADGAASVAPSPAVGEGTVVPLPRVARDGWRPLLYRRDIGRAAGLFAASLAVGLLIGLANLLPIMDGPALDRSGYNLVLLEPFDEDVL